MQAARTDVFGFFIHLIGDLREALDAVVGECHAQAFGGQQRLVLLGERRMRLAQDALEVVRR